MKPRTELGVWNLPPHPSETPGIKSISKHLKAKIITP